MIITKVKNNLVLPNNLFIYVFDGNGIEKFINEFKIK